ncbi:MAG: hypothetical protein ACI8YQ_004911 [Polaribacter sp.]|jgi:hypothetical protein
MSFCQLVFYNGWFPIEQLCYDKEWVIDFYTKERKEAFHETLSDGQFVKKLRKRFGYDHVPLSIERLKELEDKYFHKVRFNSEFVETHSKKID